MSGVRGRVVRVEGAGLVGEVAIVGLGLWGWVCGVRPVELGQWG